MFSVDSDELLGGVGEPAPKEREDQRFESTLTPQLGTSLQQIKRRLRYIVHSKELSPSNPALRILVDLPNRLMHLADGDEEPAWTFELLNQLLGHRRRSGSDVDCIPSSFGEISGRGARSSVADYDFEGGRRGGEGVGGGRRALEGGERVGDESGNVVDTEDEASGSDEVGENGEEVATARA